jgi:hypothetical protein
MIIKGIGASDVGASDVAPAMNEQEVVNFLQSKLNLQLATIDESGDPNIQLYGSTMKKIQKSCTS